MKRLLLIPLFLLCGCALKRPVRALYCVEKRPNGTCETWATPQTATGDLPFPGPKITGQK